MNATDSRPKKPRFNAEAARFAIAGLLNHAGADMLSGLGVLVSVINDAIATADADAQGDLRTAVIALITESAPEGSVLQ